MLLDKPPPMEVTPEKFQQFEKWLLEQARCAIQETALPRYCPNSQWVLTIDGGQVALKLRREDLILKAA